MNKISVDLRMRSLILVLGVIFTCVAVIVAAENDESIENIFASGGAVVGLTALIYTALNSHFQASVYLESLRIKKLENAMTFIESSTGAAMVSAVNTCAKLREQLKGKSDDEICKVLESEANREAAIMMGNYYERMELMVRLDAIDEAAVRDFYDTSIRRYWSAFSPWVHELRVKFDDHSLFEGIEFLVADRWSEKQDN